MTNTEVFSLRVVFVFFVLSFRGDYKGVTSLSSFPSALIGNPLRKVFSSSVIFPLPVVFMFVVFGGDRGSFSPIGGLTLVLSRQGRGEEKESQRRGKEYVEGLPSYYLDP